MGKVFATCGHEVTDAYAENTLVTVKAWTRENERALGWRTACAQCRKDYERVGMILHTPYEERMWLNGEIGGVAV